MQTGQVLSGDGGLGGGGGGLGGDEGLGSGGCGDGAVDVWIGVESYIAGPKTLHSFQPSPHLFTPPHIFPIRNGFFNFIYHHRNSAI